MSLWCCQHITLHKRDVTASIYDSSSGCVLSDGITKHFRPCWDVKAEDIKREFIQSKRCFLLLWQPVNFVRDDWSDHVNISWWSLRWPDVFVLILRDLCSVWLMLYASALYLLWNATARATTFRVSLNWDLRENISNAKQHCKHNQMFSHLRKLFLCVPGATCLCLVFIIVHLREKELLSYVSKHKDQWQRDVCERWEIILRTRMHTGCVCLCILFVCVDWDSGGFECNNLPHGLCVSSRAVCLCSPLRSCSY